MYFDYKLKGLRIGTHILDFEEGDCLEFKRALNGFMKNIEGLVGVP